MRSNLDAMTKSILRCATLFRTTVLLPGAGANCTRMHWCSILAVEYWPCSVVFNVQGPILRIQEGLLLFVGPMQAVGSIVVGLVGLSNTPGPSGVVGTSPHDGSAGIPQLAIVNVPVTWAATGVAGAPADVASLFCTNAAQT